MKTLMTFELLSIAALSKGQDTPGKISSGILKNRVQNFSEENDYSKLVKKIDKRNYCYLEALTDLTVPVYVNGEGVGSTATTNYIISKGTRLQVGPFKAALMQAGSGIMSIQRTLNL